ncbi:MAG: hypothetical protein KatS3mg129_0779 [Leptospiraceae bacterium]|nr:MAG: hypothetical protein KatS3mg129_0779 [Leptospiraceae bacterium]
MKNQPEKQIEIIKPEKDTFKQETVKPKGWKKWIYIALALISGVYVFIPEFSDAIPFLGWLDEGVAIFLFTYSLNRLGVRIPFLDNILSKKTGKVIKNQS